MPKYISCGFYGEGNSDEYFFQSFLDRLLDRLVPTLDHTVVVHRRRDLEGDSAESYFLSAASQAKDADFLIYHLDADGPNLARAYAERFMPYYDAVRQRPANQYNHQIVPMIPVRNLEAWLMADFGAFQQSTGIGAHFQGADLGFPEEAPQVESISDPKATLGKALRVVSPKRRAAVPIKDLFERMAQYIDFARLEQVPAYQEFLIRLKATLTDLHYLNG